MINKQTLHITVVLSNDKEIIITIDDFDTYNL